VKAALNPMPKEWQMTYKEAITHERVNQLFSYNPESGDLLRKKTYGKKSKGEIAWYEEAGKGGLKRVKVDRHFVYAGPLIYFIMNNEWPERKIRHINCNNSDFMWENLQLQSEAIPYIKRGYRKAETRIWVCESCGFEEERTGWKNLQHRYCSVICQQKHKVDLNYIGWLNGENTLHTHGTRRRALARRDGYKCATCGISEWNGQTITLEVEHRDGNSENNHHSNLELICPNCHSQTNTYKGRNKGNGRHKRRQRYADGKSY
jgi:hypothetical protein